MTETSKRKRGAQPGNSNNLKHGLYSRRFTQEETSDLAAALDTTTTLDHEIAMLRVATRRIFDLASAEELDIETGVQVLNALGGAAVRVSSLLQAEQRLKGNVSDISDALSQALSAVTRELGIIP